MKFVRLSRAECILLTVLTDKQKATGVEMGAAYACYFKGKEKASANAAMALLRLMNLKLKSINVSISRTSQLGRGSKSVYAINPAHIEFCRFLLSQQKWDWKGELKTPSKIVA